MRDVWVVGIFMLWSLYDGARSLDISNIFAEGRSTINFKDSQIVFPQRIYENGEKFPTHRHFHKRSVREKWDPRVKYFLDINGENYHFDLEYMHNFVLPGLIVQKYSDNYTWIEEEDDQSGLSCFYHGAISGSAQSRATLSLCDGMTGMFSIGGRQYLIEPLNRDSYSKEHLNQSDTTLPHQVYPLKYSHNNFHNSSDSPCGVSNTENYKHRRRKRSQPSALEDNIENMNHINNLNIDTHSYSDNLVSSHHIHKRSVSMKNYVEVMVAADYQMSKYHGENLQHYILTLMSIVNSIYRNHTIQNFIHIVVVKIIIFNSEREGPRITDNAGETLKRFCKWQSRNNQDENSRYHHDTAILLTRHDICRAPSKCDTLGLAELGTMCDPERSCAIIEDNGISAAYTIAHELGHVFDLPHDDDLRCRKPFYERDPKAKTHVMSPTIDEYTDPWSWSECSSRLLTKFLDAGYGNCLHDVPRVKRYRKHIKRIQKKHAGSLYSANKQCELVYGKGYHLCPFIAVGCHILWCTNNIENGCRTQHMPMADGTKCHTNRWCMRGQCVKRKPERKVHGGWGPWRNYGRCTRTCGGGIKKAYRECDRPEPRGGGRYCTGKRVKYRHCNIKPCPTTGDDFRAQQCAEYNSQIRYYNITPGSRWIPKYDGIQEKDWCKLFCKADSSPSHFYMLNHKVIDGTKCRPDGTDICVDGQCRLGGCDNKLGSTMKRDRCGVCGGDNASCKTISGFYNTVSYGYHNVSLIPAGATNIDIQQHGYQHLRDDENYLALVNSRSEYLLNGEFIISMYPQTIDVLGGSLQYSGSETLHERINSTGMLREDILVQVLSVGNLNPPNIRYSYTLALKQSISFIWKEDTKWTECDDICNGKRFHKIKCVREQDGSPVSDQRCENQPKPHVEWERCNPVCTVNWKVDRDACSAHCGRGTAKQYIACSLTTRYNTTLVDMKHCEKRISEIGPKPKDIVVCYGKCLETNWEYGEWTRCTASCGGGAQKRSAKCMDNRGNSVADSYCDKKELVLERTCNSQPCADWKVEDWSGCSVTCGMGSRYRKVTCMEVDKVVTDNNCISEKPTAKVECFMGNCPKWVEGPWGPCSVTCNKGVSTRTVECQSASGQLVDEVQCDAALRPYETQPCSNNPCPTTTLKATTEVPPSTTQLQLSWTTGSWTQCSASCGQGFKQRYVKCMDTSGNIHDLSLCDQSSKPTESEACVQRACGYWRSGDFGKCSTTCSDGIQTRKVVCMLMDREADSEIQCDMDVKPSAERPCNEGECKPEDFDIGVIIKNTVVGISHWRIGPWSACSSSCGEGWQRRQVLCHDEEGPSENCDGEQKPAVRQSCDAGPCPAWKYGEWTQCSASCGDMGMQKRTVLCHSGTGQTLPDSSCDIFERPPDSRMCNNGPCSKNRSWQVGPWTPCSVSCGMGVSQREVVCVSETGNARPSAECEEPKPRNTKRCTLASCPTWYTSKWSKCSVTCGSGILQRDVECHMGSERVPNDLCIGEKRPRNTKKCEEKSCLEYMWKVGSWSECSKDCGFGIKTRNVTCEDVNQGIVNSSLCEPDKRPKHKRRCSEFPCPFMWNTSPWSECSSTCGVGEQHRRVVCQAVTKEGWILPGEVPYGCRPSEKPTETQSCDYGPCQARYRWMTGMWGECSTRCGHGYERRQVQCVDWSGKRKKKKLCSKPHRPKGRRPCYNGPCYSNSCSQLREQTSIRQDGSYKLFVQGRLIEIYCRRMRHPVPEEFLTLPAGESENFSEVYPYRLKRQRTCPNNGTRQEPCKLCRRSTYRNAGRTSYSRIKIDLLTLKVQVADLTYSTSVKGKHIPFGAAGDCYSSKHCPQGQFSIDLSGTGLIVTSNTTWVSQGTNTSQRIERLQDGEIVKGSCGGLCGWCSPEYGIQLQVLS